MHSSLGNRFKCDHKMRRTSNQEKMKISSRRWEWGRESATLKCNYLITSPQRLREGKTELKFVSG